MSGNRISRPDAINLLSEAEALLRTREAVLPRRATSAVADMLDAAASNLRASTYKYPESERAALQLATIILADDEGSS